MAQDVRFEMRLEPGLVARIDIERQKVIPAPSRAAWIRDAAELVLASARTPTEQELVDAADDARNHGAEMAEAIMRQAIVIMRRKMATA